ncbi:MAG: zf-HC2 domain-containing protein [Fimbriimonas sp.]|nr:zf-HC2 domain-containing protein [Fimbriimonas sp.]
MNCRKVRELLTAYALGELDLGLHRKVATHLHGCEACMNESRAVVRDVLRISSALKADILPPAGLMASLELSLPPQQVPMRSRVLPYSLSLGAICLVLLWIFTNRLPNVHQIEALALADAPVPSRLMVDNDTKVATALIKETGLHVTPIPVSGADRFEGGTCISVSGSDLPVMMYRIGGKRVTCYQVDSACLRTHGMKAMEMMGRKIFCCSHGGGALVVIERDHLAFVFSAPMDEMSLARVAMKAIA